MGVLTVWTTSSSRWNTRQTEEETPRQFGAAWARCRAGKGLGGIYKVDGTGLVPDPCRELIEATRAQDMAFKSLRECDTLRQLTELHSATSEAMRIQEEAMRPVREFQQLMKSIESPVEAEFLRLQEAAADPLRSLNTEFVIPPLSITTPARRAYEHVAECIREFEARLDPEHEVGARLVSHGTDFVFHFERMEYSGADIITFYGVDEDGEAVQLIQNVSQLSVILVAMKKRQERARGIGFVLDD